jgi:hypothetical protein
MATTAIAVRRWLSKWSGCDIQAAKIVILTSMLEDQSQRIHSLEDELADFKQALKTRAARADSPFEQRDKIPSTAPARYVPIARRRMAAEMQSAGPATHDEQVRKNNARAMETAG